MDAVMDTVDTQASAALVTPVLEIMARGLNQYHKLEHFPVRIGRALDNDIILSDPTVSPYHLEIDQLENGQFVLRNLSQENGSRLNKHTFETATVDLDGILHLRLGTRRMRLLSQSAAVEKTSVRNCKGLYILFCSPVSALVLVALLILGFTSENYISTYTEQDFIYYISEIMPYMLVLMALTLLIVGVSRLVIQRWEVGAAVSLAALLMLMPHIAGELGHFLNYLMTADWPLDNFSLLSNFIAWPAALYMYIRMVHHAPRWPALGIAALFSAPFLGFQLSDWADRQLIANAYTTEASFNRTLSSTDIRLKPTVSIDEYMNTMRADLQEIEREDD